MRSHTVRSRASRERGGTSSVRHPMLRSPAASIRCVDGFSSPMNMDRSEMIRCAAMPDIPTRHFVLTDFCGIAHRAYIETAMNGSAPTGMTLAIAVFALRRCPQASRFRFNMGRQVARRIAGSCKRATSASISASSRQGWRLCPMFQQTTFVTDVSGCCLSISVLQHDAQFPGGKRGSRSSQARFFLLVLGQEFLPDLRPLLGHSRSSGRIFTHIPGPRHAQESLDSARTVNPGIR